MKNSSQIVSHEDCEFFKELVKTIIKTGRMNPFWQAHTVPVSEAMIMHITSGNIHSNFLLGLQNVNPLNSPLREAELKYQLYENDLCHVTTLPDSASARERAMESLLREKGYSWEDISQNLTSHLSPRDSEGWLESRNGQFCMSNLEYAELKGFVVDLSENNPSIKAVVIPANPSQGKVGLFSRADIAAVLQLDFSDILPVYFSLDPPSVHERFHPFQCMRMSSDKLHNTDLLHTLFQTDYLLKSFSVGAEVSSKPPFVQRSCSNGLTKNLPSRLKHKIRPVAERGPSLSRVHRFWIQAEELTCDQHQSGSEIEFRFGAMKMSVRSHPLLPDSDGRLQDTLHEDDPNSPEATFASDLTKHYDELGLYFPIFLRLRELCKLQVYGALVHSVLKDLKTKADGSGITVSRELLTEVQTDARQQYQSNIEKALNSMSREIGIWPEAEDYTTVSNEVDKLVRNLPYNVVAYRSDVEPIVKEGLHKKDQSVLSQIVDVFVQSSNSQLSRYSLERYVRAWLSTRNPSSARELRDFICSSMPLPTASEIRQSITRSYVSKYAAFNHFIQSLKTSPLPSSHLKFSDWVPAAQLIKDDLDSRSICYGGVLVAPKITQGRVGRFSRPAQYIGAHNCSSSFSSQRAAAGGGSSNGDGSNRSGGSGGSNGDGGKPSHRWNHVFTPKKGHVFPKTGEERERWKEVFLSVSKNGRRSNFTGLTEGEVKMDQRGIDSGAYYTHMKTKEGGLLWTKNASDGTILSGG